MIETERLVLRRWRESDIAPLAAFGADPQVMEFIGDGSTRTINETARLVERLEREWEEKGFGLFAVELKETGAFIGFVGLSVPDFLPEVLPAVEVGWRLGRDYWGCGYATEAARAALSFGTVLPQVEKIVSICQVGNGASVRIMDKIGLVFDRQTIDRTCDREVLVYRLPH